MTRTGWLGVVLLVLLAAGAAVMLRWPSRKPALDCPPEQIRWVESNGSKIAVCSSTGEGSALPAGAALTLGHKLDLNRATEQELALLPGVGPSLARAIVRRRGELGDFKSWDDVDSVIGVGQSKLEMLEQAGTLGGRDAG